MTGRTALIHGTGLMGASLGLALRAEGWAVLGWDPEPAALAAAEQRGAINRRLGSATDGIEEADLMVLAAPPTATEETLRGLDTETLVTDIASVKTPIVHAAAHLPHFVGGHPMTGGASSGPALATSTLFHGAMWILTSDNAVGEDIDAMSSVVRSVGANPVIMTAEDHDRITARISHLPHVIATSLVELAAGEETAVSLAGGGFRDLTRVAGSEPGWWTQVLTANSRQVAAAIDELTARLEHWKRALDDANSSAISEALESARRTRTGLGEHHVPVRVVLLDQPGEIARVGHAVEESGADVRDFQLRHGEHGGGGILTISVSPGAVDDLTKALVNQGFSLQD